MMLARRQHRVVPISSVVLAFSLLVGLLVRLSFLQLVLWSPVWLGLSFGVFVATNVGLGVLLDDWTTVEELQHLRKARLNNAFRRQPFTSPAAWQAASIKAAWAEKAVSSTGEQRTPSRSSWLRILQLVRRDYILPWYSRITTSTQFLDVLDATIRDCAGSLSQRLDAIDAPYFLVSQIVPRVTKHMQDFRRVETLLQPTLGTSRSHLAGASISVDPAAIIQSHFPALHRALPLSSLSNTTPAIEAHLRSKIGAALRLLLPENERSEAVLTIAREVVTTAVLLPVLEMISEADFWNKIVDEQAGKYLHER
jgi:sorting nexin-25